MKSLFISSVFVLASCFSSFSQVITDSGFVHHQIVTGVLQASYIFEGEVLATESYYSPNHDFIYTSNIVRINQAWKENEKEPFKRDEIDIPFRLYFPFSIIHLFLLACRNPYDFQSSGYRVS